MHVSIIVKFQKQIKFLYQLSEIKFYNDAPVHEEMLLRLWKNLMPDIALIDRKSTQWIDIGFQGKDP
jgi:hypothetical protein